MYTQIGLTEKIAIVEDLLLIDGGNEKKDPQVLVPNNMAEIFIPLNSEFTFKCIGSVRAVTLKEGTGYFCMPRRRGVIIPAQSNTSCLVLKISPLYAKKIARGLKEVFHGVSIFNLSAEQRKNLLKACEEKDAFKASDIIEDALESSIDLYQYNDTILHSIEQIKDSCGRTSIKDIYSSLNVSKSKLEQHFNREIGLTPKEFCKIEKINYFIKSYSESGNRNLTEITYECGYYDQSHLIKDFNYFLDTSPRRYFNSLGI